MQPDGLHQGERRADLYGLRSLGKALRLYLHLIQSVGQASRVHAALLVGGKRFAILIRLADKINRCDNGRA